MPRVLALVMLVLLAASTHLAAQQRRTFYAWWESRVVENLNLTDAQKQQIRRTVSAYRSRLIDQRAAVQKAEGELGDLFNDDRFEARKANEAIDRLAAARGDLTRTVTQMAAELRGVLTIEQWRELERRRPLAGRAGAGAAGGGAAERPVPRR